MRRQRVMAHTLILALLTTLVIAGHSYSQEPTAAGVRQLEIDADGVIEITWNPLTDTPSFIRGRIPVATMADTESRQSCEDTSIAFLSQHSDAFGIEDVSTELRIVREAGDELGMIHVTLEQVYQGVPVYNGSMKFHLSANGASVVAISNGFVPGIHLSDVEALVSSREAERIARNDLPFGELTYAPRLVIYPGTSVDPGADARLAWLVELRDDSTPARNLYVVDATQGHIVRILDLLYAQNSWPQLELPVERARHALSGSPQLLSDERFPYGPNAGEFDIGAYLVPRAGTLQPGESNRETYTANGGTSLPGTLVRIEGQASVDDQDVDNAHDFAGQTYRYYWETFGRHSYDDAGAALISTAHYGTSYANAFWNGEQMVYGDGFAVKDVVAHELTHAVTSETANLEYRWQYGALNESFSDIFASMIDREDWLIGEDLPSDALGGRDAIRDMADPTRFGQPAHTDDWLATCSDDEGVHTNSGITNKAYYNIAANSVVGKDKAERIFYRVLVHYLLASSSLEDARASAIQSAQDLYPGQTEIADAVREGFNAVGLDGEWQPSSNDCGSCAATMALAPEPDGADLLSNLRALRDGVFDEDPGQQWVQAFYNHQSEISWLLISESQLRADVTSDFRAFDPVLRALIDSDPSRTPVILTPELLEAARHALMSIAEMASSELREEITREWERVEPDRFIGWDVLRVWEQLRAEHSGRIYLPTIVQ